MQSSPKSTEGHRDGRSSPRSGRKRRLRAPALNIVSGLRVAGGHSKRQGARRDMVLAGAWTVHFRGSTRLPIRHPSRPHQSLLGTSKRSRARQKVSPSEAMPKVKNRIFADDDDLQQQGRAAVKQALQAKQQGQLRLGRDLIEVRPRSSS